MAVYVRLGWDSGLSLSCPLCRRALEGPLGARRVVASRERRRHLDDGALADDLGAAGGLEVRERREEHLLLAGEGREPRDVGAPRSMNERVTILKITLQSEWE